MINLKSNQRLYISKDLRGYVDKLISEGTIPYAVDFLKLGFAHSVRENLKKAEHFERHEITANTNILGKDQLILEAVAQWYARELTGTDLENSNSLLSFICRLAITGGRALKEDWQKRSKTQIHTSVARLSG